MGYVRRLTCSLCRGGNLKKALELRATPLANEYAKDPTLSQFRYPLNVVLCMDCGHSQIGEVVNPKILFADYAYATSTSPVTLRHLHEEVQHIKTFHEKNGLALDKKAVVVEIGSNDGAMLKMWKDAGVGTVVGIDPASAKLGAHLTDADSGIYLVHEFFNAETADYAKRTFGEVDAVVANNVLAHVPDILEVVTGVRDLLADGGTFSFEVSYLLDMVEAPLFDTIYHEHMSYHAVKPLALMLDKLGMPIHSAIRLSSQLGRGSLRVMCRKGAGSSLNSVTARGLMETEAKFGLWDMRFWSRLQGQIFEACESVHAWVDAVKALGEPVVGYGAAAKLTTLMYSLCLDASHVDFIVDDSKWKHGLFTPGTHIPIKPVEALYEAKPGVCIIFAWNFADSIIRTHAGYPGKFLVPLPEMMEVDPSQI